MVLRGGPGPAVPPWVEARCVTASFHWRSGQWREAQSCARTLISQQDAGSGPSAFPPKGGDNKTRGGCHRGTGPSRALTPPCRRLSALTPTVSCSGVQAVSIDRRLSLSVQVTPGPYAAGTPQRGFSALTPLTWPVPTQLEPTHLSLGPCRHPPLPAASTTTPAQPPVPVGVTRHFKRVSQPLLPLCSSSAMAPPDSAPVL